MTERALPAATIPAAPRPRVTRATRPWVVILAAGEGKRLARLTTALYGYPLAKQFAVLDGERSLLQRTVERCIYINPRPRILVVVGEHQLSIAREQLQHYADLEILAQPKNLDTAPGVLLPLTYIRSREPRARVAFLPSDHHVARPVCFMNAVDVALASITTNPEFITMLGVEASEPQTEYGWIRPGNQYINKNIRRIVEFIEKPPFDKALQLKNDDCLWNTFAFAAGAPALWKLFETFLPAYAAAFQQFARSIGTPRESAALAELYRSLAPANCSKDVFEKAYNLAVVRVSDSGWSDWGSPSRVLDTLSGTEAGTALARSLSDQESLAATA